MIAALRGSDPSAFTVVLPVPLLQKHTHVAPEFAPVLLCVGSHR